MIALPMTFILMNEGAGDALIDAAIPAVYSAVYTLGAYLYSISLLALLLTFCLAIAALNYWTFVYRPATLAHSRRKEKLKRIQSAGHSASVNRLAKGGASSHHMTSTSSRSESTFAYLRRVFNIMRHSLQHGITLLSFRQTQHVKKMALQHVWRTMNRAAAVQSSTTNPEAQLQSRRHSSFGYNISSGLASIENLKTAHHVGAKSSCRSNINSEYVVIASVSSDASTRKLTPTIIFEAEDIFALMRSRLLSTAEQQNKDILEGAVVSESSLSAEYRRALDVFYPDGIALSPAEIEEAGELFNQWRTSVNEHFVVQIVGSAAVQERMIRLSLFEEWLSKGILADLRNNLTDRLMDSTLQKFPSMKKRLCESSCIVKNADLSSFEFRDNMKALNVITPQRLAVLADLTGPSV